MFLELLTAGQAAYSLGSSFINRNRGRGNPTLDTLNSVVNVQENALRQRQMNLDAERRKRDIIRQSQVAAAIATASATNSGAGDSSSLSGVRSGISGQAGVNYLGVAQNQEIGNSLYSLENVRALSLLEQRKATRQSTSVLDTVGAFSKAIQGKEEQVIKAGTWGFNKFSNFISQV